MQTLDVDYTCQIYMSFFFSVAQCHEDDDVDEDEDDDAE